ncbi:Transient receptor potential cation channel [Echinococcus granulosus]|uniref:Transient receptor potential cation channel n=1 Tax=Echinococcus granulosus TaxID=6210 RepID=W6VAI5_ECHGR|nr:Transient receptor potential cation channel [Echinococcus granulosus]EUB63799.1 Transient receptor potential cation channel [Echinococcus granulosus]
MDVDQFGQEGSEEGPSVSQFLSDDDVSAKGAIVFSGLDEPVKFVTVGRVPAEKQILRIFSSAWQLKPPTLVISVHGSYANLKKRFNFTMKKGLWKTMESVGCWIIGDALDRGIGKIAGEAVTEYVEAYGGEKMLAIGVTPMNSLKFKHIFNTNASTIYYPSEEDETLTDPSMTLVQKYCAKRFHIDKNYSYLVMVSAPSDSGKQKDRNSPTTNSQTWIITENEQIIRTRVAVEQMVIGWRNSKEGKFHSSVIAASKSTHTTQRMLSDTVPGLPPMRPKFKATVEPPSPPLPQTSTVRSTEKLLTSPLDASPSARQGECSLNFFATAERRRSIGMFPVPVTLFCLQKDDTICNRSRELTNAIASILKATDEQDLGAFYLRERKPAEPLIVKSGRVSSSDATPRTSHRSSRVSFKLPSPQLRHPQEITTLNLADYMDEVLILRKMVEELNHLVSVFDCDETDMDGYVISALLSSAGLETPLNVLNIEQLEVTIRLNRADIAKEKIFTEGRHWKVRQFSVRHGLDNFMFEAILNDQEAFVSLLVENGFDLEAFLTVHTLEKLYTASLLKKDSKLETVRRIWETYRIYKMEWVMLRDIGRMVKHLLGEFYRPYYLSKHFRNMVKRAVARHEAEEKEVPITENPWTSKKGSYFAPLSPLPGKHQKQPPEVKLNPPPPSAAVVAASTESVSSTTIISPETNRISVPQNGKPSGLCVRGNGKYRRVGVVVPLENGRKHGPSGHTWRCGHDGNYKRAVRRFVANNSRELATGDGTIWSKAPIFRGEDFDVTPGCNGKYRYLGKWSRDHMDIATQRSGSEMSDLNKEAGDMLVSGTRADEKGVKVRTKMEREEEKEEEKRTEDFQLINTDPLSTTSMDDTLSALRKSSFAGRHRGHHRITVSKLSAAERSRLISAEARRREAAKAEERERKRRHRLAQDKRTLYERIRGINNQRMEQCVPEKLASFAAMQKVRLERPARELMLLCILLGKLKLAVLFWGYEKAGFASCFFYIFIPFSPGIYYLYANVNNLEPIGGAMFCTLLLGKLAAVCTDISQKLEFERYARIFESKAEEVLEACYAEDNQRARMLLYRKLQEYGHSAVIRLAARGGCIHFMSHPCCQDFLSEVWMGELSSKTTTFQLLCGAVVGLVFPFILPQVMTYSCNDTQKSLLGIDETNPSDTETSESSRDNTTFSADLECSEDGKRHKSPPTLLTASRHWLHRQIKDITQYYHAPVTRFLYNTIFYVAFLILFSNMILQNLRISYSIQEGLIFAMVLALLLEELKQAFGPGASLKEYLSDGWNKLDCAAIALYLGGFVLRTLAYLQVRDVNLVEAKRQINRDNVTCSSGFHENSSNLFDWDITSGLAVQVTQLDLRAEELTIDHPYFLLVEERFTLARIMFALSLFAFFVRLMYIFSFSIVLGPKLIMINRMVVNDLLPFLLLLVVIQAGYGVSSFVVSYPNGYYTHYSQKTLSLNMTMKHMTGGKIVYEFFMTAYFQMLGNFGLDILEGEDGSCRDDDLCPQFSSRKLSIISLSSFILLTQLLMLNLLVATFTSTYFEIEGSSTYFWSYQRYEMIQECVDRPSVAPPFTLLWYIGEIVYAVIHRLLGLCPGMDDFEPEIADDPFCRNFRGNHSLESKLMKWEFMKAQSVLRSQMDSELPVSRRSEAAWSTVITTRGVKGAAGSISARSGAGVAPVGAGGKRSNALLSDRLLEDMSSIFGSDSDFIEEKFYTLSSQVEKIPNFENRLDRIIGMVKRITIGLKRLQKSQNQTMKFLDDSGGGRLVGARKSTTPRLQSASRGIGKAIKEAVEGLSKHCQDIEEKMKEKLRIESLCVKAVLTNADPSEIPFDSVAVPPLVQPGPPSRRPEAMPPTASIYERLIASHRLWRLVPFNFERRPGMRVNIPDGMVDWKVPYPEYRPFIANADRIAYPYPEIEDGPEVDPTKLHYNTYDAPQGVSRCCLKGRVRVSRGPSEPRGLPLNPRGRSGLGGKGMLPHWGPNHVIILAFTRSGTSPADFQVAVLDRHQCSCLPWAYHRESCDFRGCAAKVMRDFLLQRTTSLYSNANSELESIKDTLIYSINEMEISLISDDFLDDHLNADHAWIEAVCINFHSKGQAPFHTDATKLFLEDSKVESARWYDFKGPINLRSSHESLLIELLQHHGKV